MSPSSPAPEYRPLLWLVAAALFIQTLDSTIVNTALPAMAEDLHESALSLHGIVVAYSLTMALLIPASGWLADRFGTRQVFVLSLLLFAAGSVLCALSTTLNQLIAARVVQGMGGSMLLPVGRLAVLRTVPRKDFLAAMSFIAIPGLIGPLLGPTLGGWLVEVATWHWIFLINLPVCALGLYMARRFLPNYQAEAAGDFDAKGYAWLSLALLALSASLEFLTLRGSGYWYAACGIGLCLAFSALYFFHAKHRPQALFALSLFRVTALRIGLIGNVACRLGSSGMTYVVPLMLQLALGYSPAKTGMLLIPVALSSIFAKRLVLVLIDRFGYRLVLISNTVAMGLSIMLFGLMTPATPTWLLLINMSAFGLFNSLQFTAVNTLSLRDVSDSQASSANGLMSVVQMSAISLGLATAAVVLGLYGQSMGLEQGDADFIRVFHASFFTLGMMTVLSTWVFWQLPKGGNGPTAAAL